jgi:hypothetical protein
LKSFGCVSITRTFVPIGKISCFSFQGSPNFLYNDFPFLAYEEIESLTALIKSGKINPVSSFFAR